MLKKMQMHLFNKGKKHNAIIPLPSQIPSREGPEVVQGAVLILPFL